ncbi:MAG: hypothetical protein ACI8X5_003299 [Planctomycetota bacterium]|jgi:hypothetical protein
MNKFVFSALATSLVGATSFANDTEWPELDRELAALNNAPLAQDHQDGLNVSGWIIGAISSESMDPPNEDTLGTGVHSAAVNLSGSVNDNYSFVLGWNFTDTGELYAPQGIAVNKTFDGTSAFTTQEGLGGLTDAYVHVAIAEGVGMKVGAFRRNVTASSTVQRNQTLFIDRSYLGAMNSSRDTGFAFDGNFSRLNWEVTFQNGASGMNDDFAYSGHVNIDIMGTSSGNEGALNAAEGTNLNVGLTFADDGSDHNAQTDQLAGGDGTGSVNVLGSSREAAQLAVFANLTSGGFSVFGEMIDQDKDANVSGVEATPYSLGLGYLFGENYEVAFRYDDWDDAANTTKYIFGVNRYVSGHDIKWQLNIGGGSSDNTANENSTLAVGVALGF